MKNLFTIFLSIIASVFLLAAPAVAQTPDGQVPAEETVCDPLTSDGVTKGLYGLCVAFCEAQDIASIDTPISPEDLESLDDDAPSGRILGNYNKKKKDADPPMPCILVAETCPCWTDAELEAIDGTSHPPYGIVECGVARDPTTGLIDTTLILENSFQHYAWVFDRHRNNVPGPELCTIRNSHVSPTISRSLSVQAGTLTHEQAASCLEQLNTHCATLGF
jgi:hypothetical protein